MKFVSPFSQENIAFWDKKKSIKEQTNTSRPFSQKLFLLIVLSDKIE